jgi:hypothetical protein
MSNDQQQRLQDSSETALACLMLQECQQDRGQRISLGGQNILACACYLERMTLEKLRKQNETGFLFKHIYFGPMSFAPGVLETSLFPTGTEAPWHRCNHSISRY